MTKLTKKTLIVATVIGALAAAPVVYAATNTHMTGTVMTGAGQTGMMTQNTGMGMGGMMGMMSMMGMGAGMTDADGNPIVMPAMTAEQLEFMRTQLDKLPADQRVLMEKQMQEHGVNLPASE